MVAGDIRNNLCNYFNHCNNCWQLLVLWQDKQANGCPTKLYCLLKTQLACKFAFTVIFQWTSQSEIFANQCHADWHIGLHILSRYSPTLAEIMLTTPFSECVVLVHLSGQWHHKSHTHWRLVQSLLSGRVDFKQEFRILGRFFFTLLDWPCKKGWDACGANGVMDRMASESRSSVESCP